MSDRGDKTRAGGRGPLPRTNRPRPEPESRRATVEVSSGLPTSGRAAESAVPGSPPKPDPKLEPAEAIEGDGPPPTAREPGAEAAPSRAPDENLSVLAERPTQLDTGQRLAAGSNPATPLRQVRLSKADGDKDKDKDKDKGDASGPATTYVGYIIDGRYRVEGILGRGGMGVVYRARHEVIDKLAAIKILLPTEDPDVVERFVNEARAATAIGNAHIVDTVDFGALPDGSTYFVMEYLEGETLARRIKRERFLPVSAAIAVARQIAEGVGAAHKAGIVHRDLKPENIFITTRDDEEDFVKLLDFGIAKIQNGQNRITRAGTIFGTPHYMSPEQAAGSDVDPRTDLYSLGVMLYEMLAGRVPFDAENPMGLLTQHLYTEPVPFGRLEDLPQPIPSAMDAIVLKCLAKQRGERYESAADLSADLERAERGEPPLAMADLLSRAERENDRRLAAAARAAMRPRERGGRTTAVVIVLSGVALALAGATLVAALGEPPSSASADAVAASAPVVSPTAGAPTPASPRRRLVSLVFSPIDGQVFRGGKSLGGMPVSVEVPPGQIVEVEVRRDGFYPERVDLDGSSDVVVKRLSAIPGVQPRVPVPSGEALDLLRRAADAGALSALLARSKADGGTPLAARGSDGGARRTPRPPAPPPPAAAPPAPPPNARTPPGAPPDPGTAGTGGSRPLAPVSSPEDKNLTPPTGP